MFSGGSGGVGGGGFGLSSISKETIQSSGSSSVLDTTSQDSSDTFSGHTIVSDSSLDNNIESSPFSHRNYYSGNTNSVNTQKHGFSNVSNFSTVSSQSSINSPIRNSMVGINSQTMVNTVTNTQTVPASSNIGPDVSVCKHGFLINRCRSCMQLPPLPPGSERVLRELQRQAKQSLRSQSQVQFGSTGNILATTATAGTNDVTGMSQQHSPLTSSSSIGPRYNRNSFHADMLLSSTQPPHPVTMIGHQQQQYGYDHKHGNNFSSIPPNTGANNNFINGSHQGVSHFSQVNNGVPLPPRSLATSPEHVYEEIPGSFFQNEGINTPMAKTSQMANSLHHPANNNNIQTLYQQQTHFGTKFNNQDNRNPKCLHKNNVGNVGVKQHSFIRPYQAPQNTNFNGAYGPSMQTTQLNQLKSHEFYPQNMHCTTGTATKRQSASKQQVSLGNLDFGMAKECDGFLVVPLRDRNSEHQTNRQPRQEGDNNQQLQQHWIKEQNNNNRSYKENPPSGFIQNVPMTSQHNDQNHAVLQQQQPDNSSQAIVHQPSDSGFHDGSGHFVTHQQQVYDGSSNVNQQPQLETGVADDGVDDKSSRFFQPIYAHARTKSVDAVIYSDSPGKFSHCKRCNRPHGLYHGVSLCHSEVEDMRQELQYLDIAGLDKNKLRGASPVLSSPSLLQNFARRRSAFAKYIPASTQKVESRNCDDPDPNIEKSEQGHENQILPENSGMCDNKITAESETVINDAYKRQSMSAESDYFSSNYNTSQSDTLSRASREYQSQQRVSYVASASDRSNDTFSEYDLKSDSSSLHKREDSGSVEYNYYLEKVKQNLEIKQKVQRIIKSSESERSDGEKSYHTDSNGLQDDSISLTSVTSLSELSIMPTDESSSSFVRSKGSSHHKSNNKGSPKTSKSHSSTIRAHLNVSADAYVSKMQRVRKPIRKKKKSSKDIEYYKLPNFAGNSSSSHVADTSKGNPKRSEISKNASFESKASSVSSKSDREETLADKHDSSSTYSVDSVKSSEKLSCRVTDFKLSDMKKNGDVIRRNGSFNFKDVSKKLSVRVTSGEQGVHSGDLKVNNGNKSTVSNSVYSSHSQVKNNSNNRLLSDLMRMNHDRQLFSFM